MRKEEQEARQREEALQTQLRKVTQQKKMAALKAQIEVYSEDRPRISSSSPHGSEPSIPDSFRTSLVDPPPPPATASIGSPPGTLPLDTLVRPDISGDIVGQLANQTRSVLLGGENVGLNAILPAGPSSSGPDSIRNTSPNDPSSLLYHRPSVPVLGPSISPILPPTDGFPPDLRPVAIQEHPPNIHCLL